jgi:hypothetical protein
MAFGRKKDTDTHRDGLIDSYIVTYKGGLRELPKAKIGKIRLDILPDRFCFSADNDVARKFWTDMEIPYLNTSAVEVTDRTVSTFEGIAGGINSRQLNQKNNIHFSFVGPGGLTVLRVEMLTGVTVMGQAKKCQEFEDRLRSHQIRREFGAGAVASPSTQDVPHGAGPSLADELAKLASLRDQGILSAEEFEAQKNKLLR